MRLRALAAASLAAPSGACTPPCTGVGCEEAYPASFLAVYRDDELLDAEPSLAAWNSTHPSNSSSRRSQSTSVPPAALSVE